MDSVNWIGLDCIYLTPPVTGRAHTENEPIITINATDQQNIERQQLVSMARCVKYTGGV